MSPARAVSSRPGRRTGALRAALLGAVCAVLAACATVPTSGPIEQGPVVDAGEATQFIRVIAAPPSVGASPAEIVRGFLEANASLESDHAIARRYLTPAGSGQWDPTASSTVYEQASLELSGDGGDRITASYEVTNRLESDGTLTPVDPPRTEEQRYLQALDRAIGVITAFQADILVVSLGFDILKGDPTGTFLLNPPVFRVIRRRLGEINRPLLVIQEGGYNIRNIRRAATAFFEQSDGNRVSD